MTDEDPDAIWRPGFTGTVVYRPVRPPPDANRTTPPDVPVVGATLVPASSASPPPPGRRRWPGVAVGLVALVVAVSVVATVVRDDEQPSSLDRIPSTVQERWSVSLDTPAVSMVSGSTDLVVVMTDSHRPAVVALDAGTGVERWRAPVPSGRVDLLEVLGDVVVSSTVSGGDRAVRALDVRSGEQRWAATMMATDQATAEDGQLVVIRAEAGSSRTAFELLDPATGDVRSSIVGDDVSWNRFGLQRREGDRIELFDRASLDPQGVIDLAGMAVSQPAEVEVAAVEAGVVLATSSTVTLIGRDGLTRSSLELAEPPAASIPVSLETLDAAGRFVAVQRGDQLIVLSSDGGTLRPLWSDTAWLMDWHVDADRQLVAVATVNGSVVVMPPLVVDATTGQTLWDGPSSVQRSSPFRMFAGDGFIAVEEPSSPGDPSEVVGYDLDRTERWRRRIGPDTAAIVVDDGLVTIDREPVTGTTTLTMFS